MKKERLLWVDVIRIVAIFLVLAGHSTKLEYIADLKSVINLISFSAVKVCVPLFIMLSGGLLLGKAENANFFYKKRASRYILPWTTWSLITAFFIYLPGSAITVGNILSGLKTSILSFWFLPMLTCLYLLTPALRKYLRSSKPVEVIYVLLIWFLAVSLLPFILNSPAFPLFIDNSLLTQTVRFSGYYIAGYLLTKYRPEEKVNFKTLVFLFAVGSFYIIFLTLRKSAGELYFNYNSPGVVLESITAFLLIKKIFLSGRIIIAPSFKKILHKLSSASYGIYLSHLLMIAFLSKYISYPIYINRYIFSNYVSGAVLFLICFLLISLLKKIPHIGNIFG